MQLFIHRNDLRVRDNIGLFRAGAAEPVIPVYIRDPRRASLIGPEKTAFRDRGLQKLQEQYREHGSDLIVREGKTAAILSSIAQEHDISGIAYNRHYAPSERHIEQEIDKSRFNATAYDDRVLVPPRWFENDHDTFSPFYRRWKEKEKQDAVGVPSQLADISAPDVEKSQESTIDLPDAGEEAARDRWTAFKAGALYEYKEQRDDVADPDAVSRLSPYYSNGMIGIRTIYHEVQTCIQQENDDNAIRNIAKYRSELAWREFFYQVLYHHPESVENNYKSFEREIAWENDADLFEAWKEGRTGIPFVDAGMRELNETGYMHNRTRQNVASFLTKHLMIDWRKGRDYFRKKLIDHDVASNTGGWQWAASTGTDSVPIRIFNPIKQGKRYDPEAEYIKRWVPELSGLDPNQIHEWPQLEEEQRKALAESYPAPIIKYQKRYHEGKQMFEQALGR